MAPLGGYTSPENMRLILDVVRYLKASGFVIDAGRGNSQFVSPSAPIYIRNDTGVEIPAFGCVQSTGTVEAGGQNYITVDHPADNTGIAGGYLFNGIAPIETGGYGLAYTGPLARMLTDGSAVTCGASWQPVVGSFAIATGGSIFTAIGEDDIETNVMRGLFKGGGGATLYRAVMKAAWSSNTVNCDIYSIDGTTFTDTGTDANVYDGLSIFASLTTGASMLVLLQAGKYYAIQAPCP